MATFIQWQPPEHLHRFNYKKQNMKTQKLSSKLTLCLRVSIGGKGKRIRIRIRMRIRIRIRMRIRIRNQKE